MATNREDQSLLQEYVNLKRLIDSYKSRTVETAAPHMVPYNPAHHRSRINSTQFPRNSNVYAKNHPLPKGSSVYALNRTTRPRPSYQGSGSQMVVNGPTYHSFPKQNISVMGHQLRTSHISPNPSQTSRIVNKFQVRSQSLAVKNTPTTFARPGPFTSKECLPNTSVQTTVSNNFGINKRAQPAINILRKNYLQLQAESTRSTITNKLASTEKPKTTSALKTVQEKPSLSQVTAVRDTVTCKVALTKIPPTKPTPKSVSRMGCGVQLHKTEASKTPKRLRTQFSTQKSSMAAQFRRAIRVPQLKYKYVRPDSTMRLPGSSRTPPSGSTCPVARASSKYKLVATPKKNSSKTTATSVQPAKSLVRRQGHASKYSWSVGGSQVPRRSPSGQNFIRSRYRLSKTSMRISPRLVRRVNKYSVKYLPSSRTASPRALTAKSSFGSGSYFTHVQLKGKSDLVVIGGITYKSSKTKLSRTANDTARGPRQRRPTNPQIVNVRGVRFSMDANRRVLQRLSTTEQQPQRANLTPLNANKPKDLKRIDIGGETYIQTRPGVLVRSNTNQLRSLANRVVNRSIFRLRASKGKAQQYCLFYNKFGKCNNKEKGLCPYIHDPEKIAICKRFLRGECTVERCPFSHTVCRSKMPVCTFFLHGRCNSDSCNYRHVNVNPNADVCLDFAKGYCPLGEKCKNWHVSVCPQFEQTGKCDKANKCPLKHQQRAAKGPKRGREASSAALNPRLSADKDPTYEPPTGPQSCLSFISLESDLAVGAPPQKVQKDVPLQIKPDFLKIS